MKNNQADRKLYGSKESFARDVRLWLKNYEETGCADVFIAYSIIKLVKQDLNIQTGE